jgi:phosphoserine phosphatase
MEIDDGRLTAKEVQPIPVRQGKVGTLQRIIGAEPVLTASDSRNDIPMLLTSTMVKVRINSRGRSMEEFFQSVGAPPDDMWVNIEQPTVLTREEFAGLWQTSK